MYLETSRKAYLIHSNQVPSQSRKVKESHFDEPSKTGHLARPLMCNGEMFFVGYAFCSLEMSGRYRW